MGIPPVNLQKINKFSRIREYIIWMTIRKGNGTLLGNKDDTNLFKGS